MWCYDDLLQAAATADEFMQQLPQYDKDLAKQLQDAEDAGEVSNSNWWQLIRHVLKSKHVWFVSWIGWLQKIAATKII